MYNYIVIYIIGELYRKQKNENINKGDKRL